ncbi:MAG: grpE [Herminiimonas sp.]|nr:grpE [Herminiimonas sp.]
MQNEHEMRNQEKPAERFSPPDMPASDADQPDFNDPQLEEQLARTESSLAEMEDAFLRAKADVENFRRRAQEDLAIAHKYAIESFAETLLPVKDSLEMALEVETPSVESLREGVEMTLKQLSSAFEKTRLTEVNPKPGEKFDPGKHQAISMVPSNQPPNTVVNVLQKGYLIADRLLRPALVTVAQQDAGGNPP